MGNIGERIASKREALKLSQAQLALRLGVGVGSISRYERNEIEPRARVLKLLADSLECSIDFLISGEESRMQKAASGSRR